METFPPAEEELIPQSRALKVLSKNLRLSNDSFFLGVF